MRRLMRFFFHHFYHTFAFTYDAVAAVVSVGRWRDWGAACLPYLQGPRVLELGPGPGHLQVLLNQHGFTCLAIEESEQMSKLARRRLSQGGLPTGVIRGTAQCLPLEAGSVHSVVATFPSEYILAAGTLDEAWRVLAPGGQLVIIPLAWMHGPSLPDRLARLLFRITGQGQPLTEATLEAVKGLFNETRFEVSLHQVDIRQSTVLVVLCKKASAA